MGYDLHITRKDCWAEEEDSRSITLPEWQAYVAGDPEVIADPENPNEDNYVYIRAAGNWPLWFNPRLGNIYTKNPEQDVIDKMVKIAQTLNARVQGDDQEFYDFTGNSYRLDEELSKQESKGGNSTDRYVWYFCAIVLVASILWHLFIAK